MNWVQKIDEWELVAEAPGLSLIQLNSDISIEDILPGMVKGGPLPPRASTRRDEEERAREYLRNDPRPPKTHWQLVKNEINELVCGETEKYEELRKKIKSHVEVGEKGVVAIISAKVATVLGVETGAITGFCALCLFSAKNIGINAYCSSITQNIT